MLYRLLSFGLAIVSPLKPLFRLVVRVLTGHKRQIRGHVLPVNIPLGEPVQAMLSREVLAELIASSTAVGAMDECLCRKVGGCTDYPGDLGCLVLGDAVHALHPGLGHAVDQEEALAIVDRALWLGLAPMVVHFKSDAVLWSLKHSKMLTVCFCCPCHCLLRDALATGGTGDGKLTGLPGVAIAYDRQKCVGCGRCEPACIAGALRMNEGKPEIDRDNCLACARCVMACAHGALAVHSAGEPDADSLIQVYRHRTAGNGVFR